MKLLIKMMIGLFLIGFVVNLAGLPFRFFNQDIAYQSCALLREDFPAGVSRDDAAASVMRAQGKAKPAVDKDVYKLNTIFDKDDNGTACQNKNTPVAAADVGFLWSKWKP